MPERIQFHLDENVDSKIARALMRYGIDVTMSTAVGLRSASDEDHLAFAQREQRVIFTHDDDFLRLASQTNDHAGIIYCHKTKRTVGEIIRSLILVYEVLLPEEIAGSVEFI